jgi:hypothetical protein
VTYCVYLGIMFHAHDVGSRKAKGRVFIPDRFRLNVKNEDLTPRIFRVDQ